MLTDRTEVLDSTNSILVVDDEEKILKSIRRLLADEFRVLTANSAQEALDIISSGEEIGLIISDQRMPGITGVEFLQKARELLPDVPRVILTGYADINASIDAINRGGAYRFITKPWNDEELLQVSRDGTGKYNLIRENQRLNSVIRRQNQELRNWSTQLERLVQEKTAKVKEQNIKLQELNEHLHQGFHDSIMAFSALIELRNSRVKSHSKNVAELSREISMKLGLDTKETENIYVASLLHDIGKIGMPDALVDMFPEHMSPSELEEYSHHPVRGQTAIDTVGGLRDAGIMIRHHHESYDGKGFPDGLKGDSIPIGSRIIAIADYVDARIISSLGSGSLDTETGKLKKLLKVRFDPQLFQPVMEAAKKLYASFLSTSNVTELGIPVDKLRTGMVLNRDVLSGTGVFLLKKGTVIEERHIISLKRFNALDPLKENVYIQLSRE